MVSCLQELKLGLVTVCLLSSHCVSRRLLQLIGDQPDSGQYTDGLWTGPSAELNVTGFCSGVVQLLVVRAPARKACRNKHEKISHLDLYSTNRGKFIKKYTRGKLTQGAIQDVQLDLGSGQQTDLRSKGFIFGRNGRRQLSHAYTVATESGHTTILWLRKLVTRQYCGNGGW